MKKQWFGLCMGVLWSVVFATAMHDWTIGVCMGICMGLAFGLFDTESRKDETEKGEEQ